MNIFSKLMTIATLTSMFGFVFSGMLIELSYSFRVVSSLSVLIAFFLLISTKLKIDLISWGIWIGIAAGCSVSNLSMYLSDAALLVCQLTSLLVMSFTIYKIHQLNRITRAKIKELTKQLELNR
ncbi:hypothetical protein [Bacillus bombysepticus]|uniref:hypothetical protein n=1 Tax=Bacillus bombysepticus TaxID=658666 RepID=UPI00301A9F11